MHRLPIDLIDLQEDLTNGMATGERCCIPQIEHMFAWKRGFQQAMVGFPQHGKTELSNFLMLAKMRKDKWKFCVWSPEMVSGKKSNGKIELSANELTMTLVHMLTGRSPFKHQWEFKSIVPIDNETFKAAVEFLNKHLIIISPDKTDWRSVMECVNYWYEKEGFDVFMGDPFTNIEPEGERDDKFLRIVLDEFKKFSVANDIITHWAVHPKSGTPRQDDVTKKVIPPDQYSIAGGAMWNNKLDMSMSVTRLEYFIDKQSPYVEFETHKIKKQNLVAKPNKFSECEYYWPTARYYFDKICPLDGSRVPHDYGDL